MAKFNIVNINAPKSRDSLERILPVIANDINIVKTNMVKLVSLQGGTPKTRAENFFSTALQREEKYESQFGRTSPTRIEERKTSKGGGGGGLFGFNTSVLDFVKRIANALIKGALVALSGFGIAKLLENDEVRNTIKSFLKNLFITTLDLLKKGFNLISETLTENWPEIKQALIDTFVAVKNTLLIALSKMGDLLSGDSGKVIWEGVYQIIKEIFSVIGKILNTEIEIEGVKVSLGVIIGAAAAALVALKLAAAAAAAALTSMVLGRGRGSPAGVPLPQGGQPTTQPLPPQTQTQPPKPETKLERTQRGRESLKKIETERLQKEIKEIQEKGSRGVPALPWWTRLGVGIAALVTPGNIAQDTGEDEEIAKRRPAPLPPISQSFPENRSTEPSRVVSARDLLNAIGKSESRGDYDATLGFGKFDPQWYKTGDKRLTDLSLDEVYRLQKDILNHPENKYNSSAVGKYQVVKSTLFGKKGTPQKPESGSIADILNLKPSDKFTPDLQEDIGMALLKRRGLDSFIAGTLPESDFMGNLQKEWQGFRDTGLTSLAQLKYSVPVNTGNRIAESSTNLDNEKLVAMAGNGIYNDNRVTNNVQNNNKTDSNGEVSSPYNDDPLFDMLVGKLF